MYRTDYLIAKLAYGNVLELGCFNGRRSHVIDMMGHNVVGVDEDRDAIAKARKYAEECCLENCQFECLEDWTGKQRFDTIVVSNWSDDIQSSVFGQIDRHMKRNGQVILTIPYSTHLLGARNLSVASLKTAQKELSTQFSALKEIKDEFTKWGIFVFRHDHHDRTHETEAGTSDATRVSCPKASVVLTTYNRGKMVATAIDSILKQTYPNIELIVVNDGSTDGTKNVLAGYGSKIIAINKARNEGVASATNTGLEASSGEYINRFDDDDTMFPRKIECQMKKFSRDHTLGMVYTGGYLKMAYNDKKVFDYIGRYVRLSQYAMNPNLNILNTAVLLKKRCLDEVGYYNAKLKTMEECDRFIRIMARFNYAFIPIPGVTYLKHGDNVTITGRKIIRESARQIQRDLVEQIGIEKVFPGIEDIENEDEKRRQYSLVFLRRGRFSAGKGCHELACEDFERALSYAPENRAAKKYLKKAQEALAKQDKEEGVAREANQTKQEPSKSGEKILSTV